MKDSDYKFNMTSIGYTNYLDEKNSREHMKNRFGFSLGFQFYKNNNFMSGTTVRLNRTTLKDLIIIDDFFFIVDDILLFSSIDFFWGYNYNVHNRLSIEPYSGLVISSFSISEKETNFKKNYERIGIPLGVRFNLHLLRNKTTGESSGIFINNSYNYIGFKRIHNSFSNFTYIYEIGFFSNKEIKKKKRR